MADPFAPARAIADAVLYEGYVLYPYRAAAAKNRMRWQWGVLGPSEGGPGSEPPRASTSLLIERTDDAATPAQLRLRLRFLQVVAREVQRMRPDGTAERLDSVSVRDEIHVSFDDAVERTVDLTVPIQCDGRHEHHFTVTPHHTTTRLDHDGLSGDDGQELRLVSDARSLSGTIVVEVESGDADSCVAHVRVENTTEMAGAAAERGLADGAEPDPAWWSLVGVHLLAHARGAVFVSTIDPPDELAPLAAHCRPDRLWPVLVGGDRRSSLVLASPVILHDQPQIAPESPSEFHDGLEIDEMLVLRVQTMTDDEKREARATHPRAAAIVDQADDLATDALSALHGTVRASAPPTERWWEPGVDGRFDPRSDGVDVGGRLLTRGSAVRLRPSRRADAHDLFLRDRLATVRAVVHDVDGSVHVAVTVDDDPAAEINDGTGRYLYFSPAEVEPVDPP